MNRTLSTLLVLLDKRRSALVKSIIRLANHRLACANDRLAARVGWDVAPARTGWRVP